FKGFIEIRVIDEGIGIPAETMDSLFDPFLRAGNTKKIQGTGLGLAIVRQALDLCGGDVVVRSEVGVGSTFLVTLPLSPGTSE
ncbi:MAG: hybrid sensor histidine kinase/response regulator, partial [Sphaerospermopsis sp. SIO1G2]|nr:hybrid sensor histidine kinase/response regulator [Sphaerospermopsis sp. SIO1G2]